MTTRGRLQLRRFRPFSLSKGNSGDAAATIQGPCLVLPSKSLTLLGSVVAWTRMLFDEMAWHGICTFVPDVLRRIITRQTLLHGTVQQITCTILYPLLRLECSMHANAIRPSYGSLTVLHWGPNGSPALSRLGESVMSA